MTGNMLKAQLGLQNIKYVYIQRLMQSGTPTYVLSLDSRFKRGYLSVIRVLKAPSQQILRIKKVSGGITKKKAKLTMPIRLDVLQDFMVPNNSVFIIRDFAGDYLRDKTLYEEVRNNIQIIYWGERRCYN